MMNQMFNKGPHARSLFLLATLMALGALSVAGCAPKEDPVPAPTPAVKSSPTGEGGLTAGDANQPAPVQPATRSTKIATD